MQKLFCSAVTVMLFFIMQPVFSQSSYINHTLKQGENLSGLAKQYNTNVGDIMRINGMHADTKLVYGSVIKIPSNAPTAMQDKRTAMATSGTNPLMQPLNKASSNTITHKVVRGETLFSISKHYNISMQQIKSWNNLKNNSADIGSVLIVGDNNQTNKALADTKRQRVETTAVQTITTMQTEQNNVAKNIDEADTLKRITNNTTANEPLKATNTDVNSDNVEPSSTSIKNSKGYFAETFKKSRRQQHLSGVSKTFKTASGWQDGKYYILADDINPGTIVKLTADNGNAVYAKVLWNMGSLKENNGVSFRVSNATAAALNENTDSFNLDIYY